MQSVQKEMDSKGEIGVIALSSFEEMGQKIDHHIKAGRKGEGIVPLETYIIPIEEIRFSSGEAKSRLPHSVRGRDIFLLCDPGNYSCTYQMRGVINHKSPDDHFQDLKRAISAVCGKALSLTVVMPQFYSSRQDRRKGRESLDCATALQELENMGVNRILSFDLHDSRVQNAVPLVSFDNLYATYQILTQFLKDERDSALDKENLVIISPDAGGVDRALYYSTILGANVSFFYKRRDADAIVNGKNPIVAHQFVGQSVEGKTVIIVDDLIATGGSILDILNELKNQGAKKIFIATTFAQFTEGIDKFQECYEQGKLDRIYSTNLTYLGEDVKNAEWFKEVDMSEAIAKFIDRLYHNKSIKPYIDATKTLTEHVKELRNTKN
ncbi:phosphoribosylpyrophosphate synthetase [Clostridia bacterium]|nr:phosphoribosylpyrophosphate synthetase [Clostridia bacterium]